MGKRKPYPDEAPVVEFEGAHWIARPGMFTEHHVVINEWLIVERGTSQRAPDCHAVIPLTDAARDVIRTVSR